MEILKDYNNIYFDLSSLADNIMATKKFEKDIEIYIRKMPERFILGSDYEGRDQTSHIRFVNNLKISDINKEKVFYTNAKKLYKLAILEEL